MDSGADYLEILRALHERDVKYLVVGGVAAVIHGAPVTTSDLDLVHSRTEENVERLLVVLSDIDSRYRPEREHTIEPSADSLAGPGHHLFMTRFGPLDLLGEVGRGSSYEDLVVDTVISELDEMNVRILSLRRLIEIKREVGRTKDHLMLPILIQTLREQGEA